MLEVNNISVAAHNGKLLLHDISFTLPQGHILGLTGQSGSGKTTLIKSIMGILDKSCGIKSGNVLVDGVDINALPSGKRRKICGTLLGFIPQNPMTAFDGRIKLGRQMTETFRLHRNISKDEAEQMAKNHLKTVNLTDAARILNSYPEQISGGMLQRVVMAILIGLNPRYILADEPTSALDDANRQLLLQLLREQATNAGILMISHDVAAMQDLCEDVLVMENGAITEHGTIEQLLTEPKRAWTKRFSAAVCKPDKGEWVWREL